MRPPDTWILTEVKFDEAGIPYCYREPQPCLTATDSGLYTEAYVTELRAKCAELEAEDSAVQLLKDSTINQQAERIKELEAERDSLLIRGKELEEKVNFLRNLVEEQAERVHLLESALTEAVDEIASLACRDNSCDPHPDLSEYTLLLKKGD